jgi:hypothetical protein
MPHHGDDGAGERQGQRQQREQLQDEQRVALQPLEERRRLPVPPARLPQEQARHHPFAAADLEEVEEHQRQGQGEQCERQR